MNLLAIVGSPRKNTATNILIDNAIERAMANLQDCNVKKPHRVDHDIRFCKN